MARVAWVWIGILCLTFAQGPVSATSAGSSAPGQGSAHVAAKPEPRVVEGRVTIKLESRELTVGQYNKIPLDLHGYPVERITGDFGPTAEMEYPPDPDSGVLYLKRDSVGGTYVEVLPTRMGKFPLRLHFGFADGGLEAETVEVEVDRIRDDAPRRFILSDPMAVINFTKKAGTLHFALSPQPIKELLIPVAFYHGVHPAIPLYPIPGAIRDEIAVTVIPRKNQEPPVVYDLPTGEVKAVRLGQALIKVTLRGKSAYACIDVMQHADVWNERSNCNDFLPPDLSEPIDGPSQMAEPEHPASQ